jgi:hypothetical protein
VPFSQYATLCTSRNFPYLSGNPTLPNKKHSANRSSELRPLHSFPPQFADSVYQYDLKAQSKIA